MAQLARSRKTTGFLVGIAVAAIVIYFSTPEMPFSLTRLFQGWENKTYDLRYFIQLGGETNREDIDDVVIIEIDDESLARLGRFQNWPRLYHAKVADYLSQGGARAVVFDILFVESDSLMPEVIQLYEDTKTEEVSRLMQELKVPLKSQHVPLAIDAVLYAWGYDLDFGKVAAERGNVYFPFHANTGPLKDSSDAPIRGRAFRFRPEVTDKYAYMLTAGDLYRVGEVILPVPVLLAAAKGTGHYNIEPDEDGVTRRIPPFLAVGDRCYPSMDFQIAMDLMGIKPSEVTVDLGKEIRWGDRLRIPVDNDGRMLITYFGNFKKFRYISYADILQELVPTEYFKDKIVIVGATAAGLMDLRVVPFNNTFPGPEIHANIINTLLTGKFVRVVPWWLSLAVVVGFGLLTVLISLRFKPLVAGAILFAVMLVYFFFSLFIFDKWLIWVELVRPLVVVVFTNMAILGYRFLTEEKQKLWIKNMFQGYMSKDLVDKILANPEMLQMGGEKKEITVFFSDIRGFSSFSEKLGSPEKLIALINEYLGAMSDVVLEHGGYISKYEGDAIMAFWGAPTDDPHHADSCINCVWAMKQRLNLLNVDLAKRGMPDLFTRFGINTGLVTVGNVGSERKKSYTAMGDSVNLGSRLEGANKEYGTAIMVSEFTLARVAKDYPVRELDLLRVVGKEQPVRVYELLGLSDSDVSDKKRKCLEAYLRGLALYRERKWDEAIAVFQQALEIDPEDGPSKTYIERCQDFKVLPPPEPWDGVFVMKTK